MYVFHNIIPRIQGKYRKIFSCWMWKLIFLFYFTCNLRKRNTIIWRRRIRKQKIITFKSNRIPRIVHIRTSTKRIKIIENFSSKSIYNLRKYINFRLRIIAFGMNLNGRGRREERSLVFSFLLLFSNFRCIE